MLVANNSQLKSIIVDLRNPLEDFEAELQLTIQFSRELLEVLKQTVEIRRTEIQTIREEELKRTVEEKLK